MAVSMGIQLALDLGSCSRGPLAFDLGSQLAQGALWFSKGASLTLDLGNIATSRGQLALDRGPHLYPVAMVSEEAPLTLDLEPIALGADCLLIWSPCQIKPLERACLLSDVTWQPLSVKR